MFVRGSGVVIDEPTVAAVDRRTSEVVEVGQAALQRVDDDDRLHAVWPVQCGAVADAGVAQRFLTRLLRPCRGSFIERTRVVLTVPSSTTRMERRVARDAVRRAGASNVYLIEQPVAAALGGDLPVHEPVGTMVVVAGAGITEAALLSLGCVVGVSAVRSGGADVDAAVKLAMRRDYGMSITDRTAEEIKLATNQIGRDQRQVLIEASGRMLADGSMVTALLERDEVQPAVDEYIVRILESVRACLVQAPAELAQDLFTRGINLAGAASLSTGLSDAVSETFGLQARLMEQPAHVAVLGAGKCLEAIERLGSLFVPPG